MKAVMHVLTGAGLFYLALATFPVASVMASEPVALYISEVQMSNKILIRVQHNQAPAPNAQVSLYDWRGKLIKAVELDHYGAAWVTLSKTPWIEVTASIQGMWSTRRVYAVTQKGDSRR